MIVPFFFRVRAQRRTRVARGGPRELPRQLMRDYGLETWPKGPPITLWPFW